VRICGSAGEVQSVSDDMQPACSRRRCARAGGGQAITSATLWQRHGEGRRDAATRFSRGKAGAALLREVSGCVLVVDEILQPKALPVFLLAVMTTTSEGIVLPVGGVIHPDKDLNLQGQIQVKTEKPTHWFGRRQHRNVALLLRRRLGVLVCNTMVNFEQWQCLIYGRGRDRLSTVSRSQDMRTKARLKEGSRRSSKFSLLFSFLCSPFLSSVFLDWRFGV